MEYIIYSFLACFVVSLHLFSLKLISLYPMYFYSLLGFTTITLLLSRYSERISKNSYLYLELHNTDITPLYLTSSNNPNSKNSLCCP